MEKFDAAYAQNMINDQRLGVEKFTEALQIAKNKDYKDFLQKGLKIVKHHYEEALRLQDKITE